MTYEEFKKRYTYTPSVDCLGEGGFGSVFKAYDTIINKSVAIKIAKVRDGFENIRLKNEVEMVVALPVHKNIARYEDCYTFTSFDGEYDFGILQYYEDGNLLQLLGKGILSYEEKYSILIQILDGLKFLHDNGIIHRDLKPQNILMVMHNGEYTPKITDFGISKKIDVSNSSVFNNSLVGVGTLSYASPEQLKSKNIRKNTDLWSFGIIAFQLLSGALPFDAGDYESGSAEGQQELLRRINEAKLPQIIESITEPWRSIIKSCVVADNEQRIHNTADCLNIIMQGSDRYKPDDNDVKSNFSDCNVRKREETKVIDIPPPDNKNNSVRNIIIGAVAVVVIGFSVWFISDKINIQERGAVENIILTPAPDMSWTVQYESYVNQADEYYNNKDYKSASDEYNKAIQQIPSSAENSTELKNGINTKILDCTNKIKEESDRIAKLEKEQKDKEEQERKNRETAEKLRDVNDDANKAKEGFGTFNLNGRSIGQGGLPRPSYNGQEDGRVVVDIVVNPSGNVIRADIGRGTHIDNLNMRKRAIDAALKAKFNHVQGNNNQSGTITYIFIKDN